MSNIYRIILAFVLGMLVAACAASATPTPTSTDLPAPRISRHPAPAVIPRYSSKLTSIPKFDPNSTDYLQVDLRSLDLTQIDMTGSLADLMHANFDSKTQWPSANRLPAGFDWQKIMETGKDPGLGIRTLHAQGVTGKGVNIAIIDQPLIIEHSEYVNQIKLYEEINIFPDTVSTMHGPGVASIAVGKTVGVVPEANLYYIATFLFDSAAKSKKQDYSYYVQALHRLIEINKELPKDQKIRAVSMSIGMHPEITGYDEFLAALQEAKAAGIFAISVNLSQVYGWNMLGLGRDPRSDPNDFQSYEPALWWKESFFAEGFPTKILLLPMDSRTIASQTGTEDYVFFSQGGMSWTPPYLAGMYALAVQVKPEITPEEFWETALKTGRTIQIQHDGKDYEFGVILDPQALIEAIKSK